MDGTNDQSRTFSFREMGISLEMDELFTGQVLAFRTDRNLATLYPGWHDHFEYEIKYRRIHQYVVCLH